MPEISDKPAYIKKFLDVEATVDDAGADDELDSEHESDEGLLCLVSLFIKCLNSRLLEFIVNVEEEVFEYFKSPERKHLLWKDLDHWDDTCGTSPAFLEKLAQEIKHRHPSQQGHQDESNTNFIEVESHPIPSFPTDKDSLWCVKVKVIRPDIIYLFSTDSHQW